MYADAQAEVHRDAWQSPLSRAIQVLAIQSESLGRLEKALPTPEDDHETAALEAAGLRE
jgi:hypothetical protein